MPRGSTKPPAQLGSPQRKRAYASVDLARAEEIVNDPQFGHLYWQLPHNHPVKRCHTPGIVVALNPKRRRVFVLRAERDIAQAVSNRQSLWRAYILHDGQPNPRNPNSRSHAVHDRTARDWDEDRPETWTWHIAIALPEGARFQFGRGKIGMTRYRRHLWNLYLEVVERCQAMGLEVYNPPPRPAMSHPGAHRALNEARQREERFIAELSRNHLKWEDCLTPGGVCEAEHEPDVQRAYARWRVLNNLEAPKPGDYMPGRPGMKRSEAVPFELPQYELIVDCPPDCPRRDH